MNTFNFDPNNWNAGKLINVYDCIEKCVTDIEKECEIELSISELCNIIKDTIKCDIHNYLEIENSLIKWVKLNTSFTDLFSNKDPTIIVDREKCFIMNPYKIMDNVYIVEDEDKYRFYLLVLNHYTDSQVLKANKAFTLLIE